MAREITSAPLMGQHATRAMLERPDYLFHQLIPYIGNKRKLLPLIREAINSTGLRSGDDNSILSLSKGATITFVDLFAGSGSVSRLAKTMGFRVIANDWEPYSYYINAAYIAENSPPSFECLGGVGAAFQALNSLKPVTGYIATHYCPADDENPDFENERMFYTQENGCRIDAIREQITNWKEAGVINPAEEAVLLASLIYQAAYCSNTSGVFKGFHRGWGGATKTAWYRIRSKLAVKPPVFFDNGQKNEVYRQNAHDLVAEIPADVVYIDPPYNQHQYGSNYHLLNTVALWDKPPIERHITPGSKSAIRKDWRTSRRSLYCYKSTALPAFQKLIDNINARFILMSYSTDGLMTPRSVLEALGRRGKLWIHTRHYKRYRVSSQRPSLRPQTVEFVAVVDTALPPGANDVEDSVKLISKQADGE